MMRGTVNGVTTFYPGRHYNKEVGPGVTKIQKFYFAGTITIAVRTLTDTADTLTWILGDHLGSASTTANENGTLNSVIQYTAFGEIRLTQGLTPTKYRYTGQLAQAELGLSFYVSRFYDPLTAHFTSADTIIPEPGKSQSWDRYEYANNNPLTFSDPTGHWPEWYDYLMGANYQLLNDITFGFASKVLQLDNLNNENFQEGKELGRIGSTIIGAVLAADGAVKAITTIGSISVAGTACNAATTGGCIPVAAGAEVAGVVAAAPAMAESAYGGAILFSNSQNNIPEGPISKNVEKSIRTLEKRLSEHESKLKNYIKDPLSQDNQNLLKNAQNNEIWEKIYNGRIKKLVEEIEGFRKQIKKMKDEFGGE